MIPYVRSVLRAIAEDACTLVRLCRRSQGRHAGVDLGEDVWLPPTPMPELAPLPEYRPRVPQYTAVKPACSEWLSARYAELYQWVAEMELSIYASDVRARSYVHAAA